MKLKFSNSQLVTDVLIIGFVIVLAVVFRIIPHPYNFTPIAALALFCGAYLNKRFAIILPLSVMFFSDLFLGFHDTVFFVYGSFVLVGVLGMLLKAKKNMWTVGGGALMSSLLFFLITNFGVWMVGSMYPKTAYGLFEAYVMGLPFLRNTILGDLFYTAVFFGGYELVKYITFSSAPLLRSYENIHKNR